MNLKILVTHDEDRTTTELKFEIVHYPAGEVGLNMEDLMDFISDYGIEIKINVDLYTANDFFILHRVLSEIRYASIYCNVHYGHERNLVRLNGLNIGYMGFARQDKNKLVPPEYNRSRKLKNSIEEDGVELYETNMLNTAINVVNDLLGGTHCNLTVLDPHSSLGRGWKIIKPNILFPDIEPIFPDEGALKRYVGSVYPERDYLFARKVRGGMGHIISYNVVDTDELFDKNMDYVVFDDICDGGDTFIFLAKKLKEMGHTGKLYLQVTHGLFTKGKEELLEYYDEIRCMTEM